MTAPNGPVTAVGHFEVDGDLPEHRTTLIEASAGTGKTYALAALAVRFVAERNIPIARVLIVTFTRAATAELRDRIRQRLVEAERHLAAPRPNPDEPPADPVLAALDRCDDQERAIRAERLTRAVSEFDSATISTIHGYCSQVRASLGVLSEENVDAVPVTSETTLIREVCGDLYFQDLADHDENPLGDRSLDTLVELVNKARSLTDATLAAESGQEVDLAAIDMVERATAEIDRRLRRTGTLSFDSLLESVREAIRGDAGLVETLRAQFDVALIDEFQDTDPVQWEIFETLFAARVEGRQPVTLVLVGDPKQAIYSFRGGDIYTYLAARQQAEVMALATNHRSDPTVLAAMNALGEGQTFGDDAIAYHQVAPSPRHEHRRVVDSTGEPLPGFALRVADVDSKTPVDDIRGLVAADLAAHAHRLISGARIEDPHDAARPSRPVRPADMAVLVASTSEAHPVARALRAAGIPTVLRLRDDVADSPARQQWRILLHALDRPASLSRATAAAVSWFFGWDPADVAAALHPVSDEDALLTERLAGLQHQLTLWDRTLAEGGMAALFGAARRSDQMVDRMLRRPSGDRDLTDLEHLAELIHLEAGERSHGLTAGTALAILDGLGGTAEDEVAQDNAQRRIESDAEAVQIMTIHASKGLQFPFVFLPGMWTGGKRVGASAPFSFYDPAAGGRRLDVSSKEHPSEKKSPPPPAKMAPEAAAATKRQNCGEQHRLTYVAMTRAEHQTIAWWTPGKTTKMGSGKTAPQGSLTGLARLLFGGVGAADELTEVPEPSEVAAAVADRVADPTVMAHISVETFDAPADLTALGPLPAADRGIDADRLVVARLTEPLDRLGRVWSFSSMTRDLHAELPDFDAGDVTVEFSEDSGANDEPSFHHLGGGRDFGNLIHHVLENLDFTHPDLPGAITELLAQPSGHRVTEVQHQQLPADLAEVIRTPLGSAFEDLRLADLAPRDRLNELSFHLPLAPDRPLSGRAIGSLVADHLGPAHPLRPWAVDLASGLAPVRLQGFLTGSIDLTFRHDVDGRPRYSVVDYKTNNLTLGVAEPMVRHYRRARLVQAMAASQYALQALLYSVALHRYLRLRLPDYDPTHDLGPVAYLFVRGMVGESTPREIHPDGQVTPTGVFSWQVPTGLVEDLSAHLAHPAGNADAPASTTERPSDADTHNNSDTDTSSHTDTSSDADADSGSGSGTDTDTDTDGRVA